MSSALGTRPSALGPRPSALGPRHSALGTRHSALGWNCSVPFVALAVMLVLAFAPAPTWAQSVEWTQQMVSGPSMRSNHAMAYDSARRMTVVFGGWNGTDNNDETWEWSGTAWVQQHPIVSPSRRRDHAMVYDSARGVTVLFGGYTDGAIHYNAETWEWNGTSWTQRMVSGPSPRGSAAMAYDAARGVTVLYGGFANTDFDGETWEWNGTGAGTWSQRATTGPTPRRGHAMAYDYARHATVLFGGTTGAIAGDTWELYCRADFNGDGIVNSQDFFNFLKCFFSPEICAPPFTADFNHDGTITSQDFFDFLAVFFAGC